MNNFHLNSRVARFLGIMLAGLALFVGMSIVTGCRLVFTERYTTDYYVEDTKSNRLAARKCIETVAADLKYKEDYQYPSRIGTFVSREGELAAWPEKANHNLFIEDIIDLESLAFRLKQPGPNDLVSQHFRKGFSTNTLALLSRYTGGTNQVLQNALASDLIHVMILQINGPFYTSQRFENISLSSRTKELLAQKPTGQVKYQLNRLLLEDAYPRIIRPMKKDMVVIAYKMYTHRKTKRYLEIEQRLTEEVKLLFGNDFEVKSYSYLVP